jgi:hypothetical protein
MNLSTLDPLAVLDGDWEDLIGHVEAGYVIPIIGPGLLQVDTPDGAMPLDRYLAAQLLQRFSESPTALGELPSLNQVVCYLRHKYPHNGKPYAKINDILKKAALRPPRALCQLAEISHFNLVVTTTFDGLLEQALNEVRFGGQPITMSVDYRPSDPKDLNAEQLERLDLQPVVYHLLGKASTVNSSVICDEDLLEFVCALQSADRRPKRLLDQLMERHLLFLGTEFPDWLGRFFLRTARQRRLAEVEERLQFLADNHTRGDTNLVFFLQHFTTGTKVFHGSATEFVDELHRRWCAENPARAAVGGKQPVPPAREMPSGAVFISYAHEDLSAAQELKAALDAAQIPAWFDAQQLDAGSRFDHEIRESIASCCCFVPLVSQTTESRDEGYFVREHKLAADRAVNMHDDVRFVMPVIVDELPDDDARRARRVFAGTTLGRAPNGRPSTGFIEQVRGLHEAWKARRGPGGGARS